MEIESFEVIPMNKETIFEDCEESFEVYGITTDLHEWMKKQYEDRLNTPINESYYDYSLTKEIKEFAKVQKIFMLEPVAKLGYDMYETRSILVDSLKDVKLEGPLFNVEKIKTPDHSKDKTLVSRFDFNPVSAEFETRRVLDYPKKESYLIRYGVKIQ